MVPLFPHVATLMIGMNETAPASPAADEPDTLDPQQVEVLRRMGRAWREIRRGATAGEVRDVIYGMGGSAIEPGQMDALDVIILEGQHTMGEIAERLRIDPSTATRAVQRLIKDGLAERNVDETDARVVTVSPTERGRKIHADVARRRREVLLGIIDHFPEADREALADTLERFVAALDDVIAARKRTRR